MGRGTAFPHGSFTLAPRSPYPIRRPNLPYHDLPQRKGIKLLVVDGCGWCQGCGGGARQLLTSKFDEEVGSDYGDEEEAEEGLGRATANDDSDGEDDDVLLEQEPGGSEEDPWN